MQTECLGWYCARTKQKHEHIAAANVRKYLQMEVFHPRLRVERATRRGLVRVVEPLFPCYIFIRCDFGDRVEEIQYASGISSLVRFGDKIPIVPDGVIEELRDCFEAEEPMAVEDPIHPGAEVTVAEGSFFGIRGSVVRVLPGRERVQILLEFLGRTTLAEVDRKSLKLDDRRWAIALPSLAVASRPGVCATA